MLNHDLEISLNLAVSEATRWGHEFVTVEHVLYALLHNPSATKAVTACHGSLDLIRKDLESFFTEEITNQILKPGELPQPSIGFQRIIQRAINHARSAGKNEINGTHLLVSIFSEKDSFAV